MMKGKRDKLKAREWQDCEEMDLIGFPCLSFGLPALDKRDQRGRSASISLGRKCSSLRYRRSLRYAVPVGTIGSRNQDPS